MNTPLIMTRLYLSPQSGSFPPRRLRWSVESARLSRAAAACRGRVSAIACHPAASTYLAQPSHTTDSADDATRGQRGALARCGATHCGGAACPAAEERCRRQRLGRPQNQEVPIFKTRIFNTRGAGGWVKLVIHHRYHTVLLYTCTAVYTGIPDIRLPTVFLINNRMRPGSGIGGAGEVVHGCNPRRGRRGLAVAAGAP
jgi:hypothetical protein